MSMKRGVILTAMSWFLVIGCGGGDDAGFFGTSLEGPYPCGSTECGSGQICALFYAGIDAGVGGGNAQYCLDVPAGCIVSDCTGTECPTCVTDLCFAGPEYGAHVQARDLTCPGQ